jgi:hypothetical protein
MLQKINMYKVHVLADGYSRLGDNGFMLANGSSTLVIGPEIRVRLQQQQKYFSHKNLLCCGSGMFILDPGSEYFQSQIPDPGSRVKKNSGSRVQKNSGSRILDPDPHQRI